MLRRFAVVLVLLLAVACGGNEEPTGPEDGNAAEELVVQAANYDVVAGEETRFIAGVLTQDQLFVSYGSVDMEFFYLGTEQGEGTAEEGPKATGEFLAIEGDPSRNGPIAAPASEGRGVYSADVTFDRPGFWAVQLTADLDGSDATGRSVFEVLDEHQIPAVGEKAPRTKNRTLESDVPPEAIDSRASSGEIPDESLHELTIAESIAQKKPTLVVFSTPVYCVSRFCGPVTDTVEDLQKDYGDVANFIHVEIWYDFQKQAVNKAAAEWLLVNEDLTEPWIFLIDESGTIVERWDNVATREEVEAALKSL